MSKYTPKKPRLSYYEMRAEAMAFMEDLIKKGLSFDDLLYPVGKKYGFGRRAIKDIWDIIQGGKA